MIVVPAVDLMDGQVVRLIEGDFGRKTVFDQSPIELLNGFAQAGAVNLHLVDLSGARDPQKRQTKLIGEIIRGVQAEIQVGGGLRSVDEVAALLDVGASRVVLGSVIVEKPELGLEALESFGPSRLTFALDVRLENGVPMVMSRGWQTATGQSFHQVILPFLERGLERVLCTDIARDGRMQGPNIDLYTALVQLYPGVQIQASGGVSSRTDLQSLALSGAHSVVVGRAILSGAISAREALNYAK